MKKSLVYTKTGDKGYTSLIGGTRVQKHNNRLNGYGTVDELNSFVGMIRSYPIDAKTKETIIKIQNELFVLGAYLATDSEKSDLRNKLDTDEAKIEHLEHEMDRMESELPPLKHFILPGGHPVTTFCHICRTICRRAERIVSELSEEMEIESWVGRYLNRLSDYFFVLSRHTAKYFDAEEISWLPKL